MRSQALQKSMELSCSVPRSRSLSSLASPSSSSSSSIGSIKFSTREARAKDRSSRRWSRVRASVEGSSEGSIDDARGGGGGDRRRSSFAAGIEVSAIDRSFGGAAAEVAVWEKLGAVVRLSYGIGEIKFLIF